MRRLAPRHGRCSPTSSAASPSASSCCFLATILVFLLVAESGNPLALLQANPHIPQSTILAREKLLHLNDPLWQRYWIWFSHAIHGELRDRPSPVSRSGPSWSPTCS